jgi:integrase
MSDEPNVEQAQQKKKGKRRSPGEGSVFKPGGSPFFYIAYVVNGKQVTESARTKTKEVAIAKLRARINSVERGEQEPQRADKILLAELLTDVLLDYKVNEQSTLDDAESRVRLHLGPFFCIHVATENGRTVSLSGGVRAIHVKSTDAQRYILRRRAEGAADASTANELALLRRAFSLGVERGKIHHAPPISLPKNYDKKRTGFVEPAQFRTLMSNLPQHLKALVSLAFHTGMRRGELLDLRWSQVDLAEGIIVLSDEQTKNGEARTIPVPAEPLAMLRMQKVRRDSDDATMEFAFFRERRLCVDGPGTALVPLGDFRVGWERACCLSGLGAMVQVGVLKVGDAEEPILRYRGLLMHDLRRSAIRQLVRAGVTETVAMAISGHKTRSVFDRYNITALADLKDAAKKLDEHLSVPQQERPAASVPQEENHAAALPQRIM